MIDENSSAKPSADDPWEDVVVSMLSVNSYPVERTCRFVDGLREQGLFDPRRLETLDQAEIESRLKAGGYNRGEFMTSLFASRLVSLGQLVRYKGAATCSEALRAVSRCDVEQLLAPVKGVGPDVIRTFCILRGIKLRP